MTFPECGDCEQSPCVCELDDNAFIDGLDTEEDETVGVADESN